MNSTNIYIPIYVYMHAHVCTCMFICIFQITVVVVLEQSLYDPLNDDALGPGSKERMSMIPEMRCLWNPPGTAH